MSNEASEKPLSAREWLHRLRYQDGTRQLSRLPPVESTNWQEFLRLFESISLEQPTNTESASSSGQLEGPSNTPRLLGQSAYDAEDEELTEDRIIEFLVPSDDDECQDAPFPCKKPADLPRIENETEIMLVESLVFLETYMQSPLFGGFIETKELLNVAVVKIAEGLLTLSKFFSKAKGYAEEGRQLCAVTIASMGSTESEVVPRPLLKPQLREIDLHLNDIHADVRQFAAMFRQHILDLEGMVHNGAEHMNSSLQIDVVPSLRTLLKGTPNSVRCFAAVEGVVSCIAESPGTGYFWSLGAVCIFWTILHQQINSTFTKEVMDTRSIANAILPHSRHVYMMVDNCVTAYYTLPSNVRHAPETRHHWERLSAFYDTILEERASSVPLLKHWGVPF